MTGAKLKFLWLDDNPHRQKLAGDVEVATGVEVSFCNLKNENLTTVLPELLHSKPRQLVVIDHILDKLNNKSQNRITSRGSTVAELFREHWPWCPVVGITAAEKWKDVDQRESAMYDELYRSDKFGDFIEDLPILANGFARIKRMRRRSATSLIGLLDPPEDEADRILNVLPDELLMNPDDPSVATRFYAWLRDPFFNRPGFLYERLWTTTLLGLREESFEKVEHLFEPAKYAGVFACPSRERWWATSLRSILRKETNDRGGEMPWELGRKLKGIKEEDFSRCYRSGESFPETVAYLDESSEKRYPMRLKHTAPHPKYQDLLFFEQIRMMA